jgi:hypothetical protein
VKPAGRNDQIVAVAFIFVFAVALLVCHPRRGSASFVAVAVAVASKVERGFSPASKNPPRSGHRSAEGRSEARRA